MHPDKRIKTPHCSSTLDALRGTVARLEGELNAVKAEIARHTAGEVQFKDLDACQAFEYGRDSDVYLRMNSSNLALHVRGAYTVSFLPHETVKLLDATLSVKDLP